MDNFKPVNDVFGHERGDEVICELAEALRRSLRTSDVIARLGGDEFAVWLDETDAKGARITAEAVALAASPLSRFSADIDRPLTLSIGIATLAPGQREDLAVLLARADTAMYRAKRAGKGRIALDLEDALREDLVHNGTGNDARNKTQPPRSDMLDSGRKS